MPQQTHKQAIAFKHLWSLSERLTAIYQSGVEDKFDPSIYQSEGEDKVDPRIMLALLDVTPEAELQREIRDIIDELDIMLHIVGQQEEVIKRFIKFADEVLQTNSKKSPGQVASASPVNVQSIVADQIKSFDSRKMDLLSEVEDRIKELKGLKDSALSTAENVSLILSVYFINLARTDRDPGQRPPRSKAATSQRGSGLRGHEAGGGDGAPGQGHHGVYRHDDPLRMGLSAITCAQDLS